MLQEGPHLVHPAALVSRPSIHSLNRRQAGTPIGDDQQQVLPSSQRRIEVLQQARAEPMALIDLISRLVSDELSRRGARLLARSKLKLPMPAPRQQSVAFLRDCDGAFSISWELSRYRQSRPSCLHDTKLL